MKTAIILALFFLCANASALSVQTLDITLRMDTQGNALIRENYTMQFSSPFEFEEFKENAKNNSASLSSWQIDYNFFFPHFAERAGNTLNSSTITFDEGSRVLTLEYDLKNKFATLVKHDQRTDIYRIDDGKWNAFNEIGIIVVPENTTIRIAVPSNAEIDTTQLPEKLQLINNNQALISGLQSNSINIQYSVFKPIAPPGNIAPRVTNIYLAILITLILAVGAYIKRESIEKKIEDYIIEHSEIKSRNPEEDIDLDIDEK